MTHSGTEGLKMNVCVLISGIFLMLQTCTAMAEEASTAPVDDSYARSIVEKADLVRFPSEGFQVPINLFHQLENFSSRCFIQIGCGFVGKHNGWLDG